MKQRRPNRSEHAPRQARNEVIINKAWCADVELTFEKRLVRIEDRIGLNPLPRILPTAPAPKVILIGSYGVHSAVRAHVDGLEPFDTGLIDFGGFLPRSLL